MACSSLVPGPYRQAARVADSEKSYELRVAGFISREKARRAPDASFAPRPGLGYTPSSSI